MWVDREIGLAPASRVLVRNVVVSVAERSELIQGRVRADLLPLLALIARAIESCPAKPRRLEGVARGDDPAERDVFCRICELHEILDACGARPLRLGLAGLAAVARHRFAELLQVASHG